MNNFEFQPANAESRPSGISYFRKSEQRLEALSELLDEELYSGSVDDSRLAEFTKRITGDVDLALTEETCWFDAVEFN